MGECLVDMVLLQVACTEEECHRQQCTAAAAVVVVRLWAEVITAAHPMLPPREHTEERAAITEAEQLVGLKRQLRLALLQEDGVINREVTTRLPPLTPSPLEDLRSGRNTRQTKEFHIGIMLPLEFLRYALRNF